MKNAKLLFIDDQKSTVENFIEHLNNEGFSNIKYLEDVTSFNEVERENPDLIFLDITGVASTLDPDNEGIAILEYMKSHRPWTSIIAISGSDFPVSKANKLSGADLCITKASLTLAELVKITEEQLSKSLSPEYKNVRILTQIESQIDSLNLGWNAKRKLRKSINEAKRHEGDSEYDWKSLVINVRSILSVSADISDVLSYLQP